MGELRMAMATAVARLAATVDGLVVCVFGRAQLYRNRQDATFQDVPPSSESIQP